MGLKIRKNLPNFALLLATIIVCFSAAYGYRLFKQSKTLYNWAKSERRGWKGKLFAYDAELGFKTIPNSSGFSTFPLGPDLPVKHDANGFRVPLNDTLAHPARPLLLFLGCSFTYGEACLAEETFPFLVSHDLNGSCINAGHSGYGLTQMLLLARQLIPKYKPDYVVVQFSPWLIDRCLIGQAPSWFAVNPTPFISRNPDGALYVHPPLFRGKGFDVPISDYYQNHDRGLLDFMSFFFRVGATLVIYQDWNQGWVKLKTFLAKRRGQPLFFSLGDLGSSATDYVYGEIHDLCRQNGARMVILRIGQAQSARSRNIVAPPAFPDALFADADSAMMAPLLEKTPEASLKAYGHWRGDPPQLVDVHPNPKAHRIIADEIVRVIRSNQAP